MNWRHYFFGINSWWARFCRWIGKPGWIYYKEPDIEPVSPIEPLPEPPEPQKPSKPSVLFPKVAKNDTYLKTRFFWTPFLIPTLLINRAITHEEFTHFLNRIVNNGWGNGLRVFSKGIWEAHWLRMLNFPFERDNNDRFRLDRTSLHWLSTLLRRLEEIVKRKLFPIVTLEDNCSLHERRSGFWSEHWMNGFNNANGTSPWMPSIYHYYEKEWHDPDHIREFRAKRALVGLPANPTDRDIQRWITMLDNTGKQTEEFNDYLVNTLDTAFGNEIGYEAVNEGMAGDVWHRIQHKLLQEYNIPLIRKFTSISPDSRFDWFYQKHTVHSAFIPSVHSIGNVTDYLNRRQICPIKPIIASADGTKPPEDPNDWKTLVKRVRDDDLRGFEGNLRPIFELKDGRWENVCGKEDWSLTSMPWKWANAVRDGINE